MGGKRYNGKCSGCKKHHTALLSRIENAKVDDRWRVRWLSAEGAIVLDCPRGGPAVSCECGKRVRLSPVQGTVVHEKVCDGRCMSATGHKCECSCGGANHGANGHAH